MGSNREELAKVTGLRIADEPKYVYTRSSHFSSSRTWLRNLQPRRFADKSRTRFSESLGLRQRLRGLDVAVDNSLFVARKSCNPITPGSGNNDRERRTGFAWISDLIGAIWMLEQRAL